MLHQPPTSAADGSALVLGPSTSGTPASPRPDAPGPTGSTGSTVPSIAVVGDTTGAAALVRSLLAAGLHASVSTTTAGTLGPVSVPTVLYRPAASAAASAVAA